MALDIIVQAQAAGATWTLYGRHTRGGWSFQTDLDDRTVTPLLGKQVRHLSDEMNSWNDALATFDQQPWYRFQPVQVHPQFRDSIWHAFEERLQRYGSTEAVAARWRAYCKAD